MTCSGMVEMMIDGVRVFMDRSCYNVNSGDMEGIFSGRMMYGVLDVKNRVVIDIGAGCGDTPLYYAVRGARLVYAIEPNPAMYRAMLRVIEANDMGDRIIPMAVALSDRDGVVRVNPENYGYWYGLFNAVGEGDFEVEFMTYETMKYLLIHDGVEYVLKSDCEGCEQYLLGKDLTVFKEVLIEYHGDWLGEQLEEQLIKQGFKTKFYDIFGGRWVGLIHGVRK